jgi:hypothetical protein
VPPPEPGNGGSDRGSFDSLNPASSHERQRIVADIRGRPSRFRRKGLVPARGPGKIRLDMREKRPKLRAPRKGEWQG